MTIEEYLEFCSTHPNERYELLDGQLIMQAGGSVNHARIASNINGILSNKLQGNCEAFTSDVIFKLPSGNIVLPDVTVTCDERDHTNDEYIQYPSVVFEVLSPGTENIDRGRKFTEYRDCPSIQEYVMVNIKIPLIELFRREKKDMWTYHMFRPDDIVPLKSIGINLPVNDVYKRVLFQ